MRSFALAILASLVGCGVSKPSPLPPSSSAPEPASTAVASGETLPTATPLPRECRPPSLNPELGPRTLVVAVVQGQPGPFQGPPAYLSALANSVGSDRTYVLLSTSKIRFAHTGTVTLRGKHLDVTFCVSDGKPSALVDYGKFKFVHPVYEDPSVWSSADLKSGGPIDVSLVSME